MDSTQETYMFGIALGYAMGHADAASGGPGAAPVPFDRIAFAADYVNARSGAVKGPGPIPSIQDAHRNYVDHGSVFAR